MNERGKRPGAEQVARHVDGAIAAKAGSHGLENEVSGAGRVVVLRIQGWMGGIGAGVQRIEREAVADGF